MHGWRKCANKLASLTALLSKVSPLSTLTATAVLCQLARYTVANPPWPILSSSWISCPSRRCTSTLAAS
eukprot:5401947-Prymnesium_polylepis.3